MTKERKQELDALCEQAIKEDRQLAEPVEFYSPGCPGLILCPYNGRIAKAENGTERRVGEVIAQFTPHTNVQTGPGKILRIGFYASTHPQAVQWLLDRLMAPGSDICDPEQYSELAIPANERINIEKQRTLAVRNELDVWMAKHRAQEEELEKLRAAARTGKKLSPTEAAIAAAG